MHQHNGDASVLRGLVAGLAGGLVASWTMNQFQAAWTRAAAGFEKPHGAQSMQPTEGPNPNETPDSGQEQGQALSQASESQSEPKENQDDATVETAKVISKNVFGHELKESEKRSAGAAVHYAFGTLTGGLYGAIAEVAPQVTAGTGVPFGAAFWLAADEVTVPLLGLAKGPAAYPLSTHVYSLASHLVYGASAELTRRCVRRYVL